MKVSELIEALKKMPSDADVWHLWDGGLRTEINHVYLARNGLVATADDAMSVYDEDERPASAPGEKEFWQTPEYNEPRMLGETR